MIRKSLGRIIVEEPAEKITTISTTKVRVIPPAGLREQMARWSSGTQARSPEETAELMERLARLQADD